jgi:ketosteroid isomerase-like protein
MHAGFGIAIEPSLRGKIGRASGVEIEALAATVWTMRAGRVTSARLYRTKEQTLKAMGLEA